MGLCRRSIIPVGTHNSQTALCPLTEVSRAGDVVLAVPIAMLGVLKTVAVPEVVTVVTNHTHQTSTIRTARSNSLHRISIILHIDLLFGIPLALLQR